MYVDEIIGDNQRVFRRNRSTTDQIFCSYQTLVNMGVYISYFSNSRRHVTQ